jgi:hypothetical protein
MAANSDCVLSRGAHVACRVHVVTSGSTTLALGQRTAPAYSALRMAIPCVYKLRLPD